MQGVTVALAVKVQTPVRTWDQLELITGCVLLLGLPCIDRGTCGLCKAWDVMRNLPWLLQCPPGGAIPRVLGRQLPLPPPPPPPPLGAFGQQLVAKGVAPRRPWAPKAPDAP